MRPVRFKTELNVNITDEIKAALSIAAEFTGMTAGQYARQAILEKLMRRPVQFGAHCRLKSDLGLCSSVL